MTETNRLKKIEQPKLILVEGKEDVGFFTKLLDSMAISNYYVRPVYGKDNFLKSLPALPKIRGFSRLTHFTIIRDKDRNNAFKSVTNSIKKMGHEPPSKHGTFTNGKPRIGVFIMPGETIEGTMLEDLCLKTVEGQPRMRCVNKFTTCVNELSDPPRNMPKSKVLAFLASQAETVNSIGLGAEKGFWDFESAHLDELKTFLNQLR